MIDISRGLSLEPASHAHRFLAALVGGGQSGRVLAALFSVKPSEISRQAKRLQALGLIHGARHGRFVFWSLTPKGQKALEVTNLSQGQLLVTVVYRLSPQSEGAWALVRETSEAGATGFAKLKIGSREECLAAWESLHDQALSLSADESAQALGIAGDIDRLYG